METRKIFGQWLVQSSIFPIQLSMMTRKTNPGFYDQTAHKEFPDEGYILNFTLNDSNALEEIVNFLNTNQCNVVYRSIVSKGAVIILENQLPQSKELQFKLKFGKPLHCKWYRKDKTYTQN